MKFILKVTLVLLVSLFGVALAEQDNPAEPPASKDKRTVSAKEPAKIAQVTQSKAEEEAKKRQEVLAEQDKVIQQADSLIKLGNANDAYKLLEPLDFERSGETHFDYLLGIAALDSDKADKATIAFERVMAVDPNFAGARLDMARAYYKLGDLARAKTEFEEVLKQEPPEAARVVIQNYLDGIKAQEHAQDNHVSAYLEVTAGHDSNVNFATSESVILLPVFNNSPITLNTTSLQTADNYVGLNGGATIVHPVNTAMMLYANAEVRKRNDLTETPYGNLYRSGNIGGIYTVNPQNILKLGLIDGAYVLGGLPYYDNAGVNLEWRHIFSSSNLLSVFSQDMNYRFKNSEQNATLNYQDFDQSMLGTSWTHILADGKSTLSVNLFMGREADVSGLRPDGGKAFDGFRLGGEEVWNEQLKLFANAGWNHADYTTENSIFLVNRQDVLTDATLGVNWHWNKQWSLRPQLAWSRQQSNIPIYSFGRLDTSVSVRCNFD